MHSISMTCRGWVPWNPWESAERKEEGWKPRPLDLQQNLWGMERGSRHYIPSGRSGSGGSEDCDEGFIVMCERTVKRVAYDREKAYN